MNELAAEVQQIMLNPLGYIHQQRLQLPPLLNSPRQHAVINKMLLSHFGLTASMSLPHRTAQLLMVKNWRILPYICLLVGTQLYKSELARQGRFLQLSTPVRFFSLLPLITGDQQISIAPIEFEQKNRMKSISLNQIQAAGLHCLRQWQSEASSEFIKRLPLLFSPELDRYQTGQQLSISWQPSFLFLQAIQYAKNYPDTM